MQNGTTLERYMEQTQTLDLPATNDVDTVPRAIVSKIAGTLAYNCRLRCSTAAKPTPTDVPTTSSPMKVRFTKEKK